MVSFEMSWLQKRFAYKYKNKDYHKHVVTISDNIIEKLGWMEGDELDQIPCKDSLILKRKKH